MVLRGGAGSRVRGGRGAANQGRARRERGGVCIMSAVRMRTKQNESKKKKRGVICIMSVARMRRKQNEGEEEAWLA